MGLRKVSAVMFPRHGRVPVSINDARDRAASKWPRIIYDFIDGSAGEGNGLTSSMQALSAIKLQPRGLVNVEQRNISQTFLGTHYDVPFGVAPMGMCNLAWSGADAMLARLAKQSNLPMGISNAASTPMEKLIEVAGNHCWFQLYPGANQELQDDMIARAASSGCDVLMLTVDVPQLARRPRELRSGFSVPFRMTPRLFLDFMMHPHWSLSTLAGGVPHTANIDRNKFGAFQRGHGRDRATWDYLKDLREQWQGCLVVKGITSVADALQARECGADAVYVSGHGGRQMESLLPPVYALAAIRDAVGKDYPLIYDTGVRGGEDIVKALVAGADFVMLGRPFLYAMGCAGEVGLKAITDILTAEVSSTLAQLGIRCLDELSRDVLSWWQPADCPNNLRGKIQ
ncbi:MAG: isopentenyl diphosphate isomerase/L-lactate dehydrogenase-like FMN-dependent dehydrogenase [Parasphingorhabdus sp.]|jgi:isopentenyl diphosphate isomerase/L-lactate dehydrogenase-like FMN-dependent dehydrogenase